MARQVTCRLCGRGFEVRGRGNLPAYCKRCTARADREIAKMPRADCRECGKTFPTRTRSVRYCSDECRTAAVRRRNREYQRRYAADPEKRAMGLARMRAWAAARKAKAQGKRPPPAGRGAKSPRRSAAPAEPYACALCGRDFVAYGGARPLHCKRCRARIDREIGRVMAVKCKECGKAFSTPSRVVRYCSKACRAAGWNRSNRESTRRRMADPEKHVMAAARQRAWAAARRGGEKGGGRRDA